MSPNYYLESEKQGNDPKTGKKKKKSPGLIMQMVAAIRRHRTQNMIRKQNIAARNMRRRTYRTKGGAK